MTSTSTSSIVQRTQRQLNAIEKTYIECCYNSVAACNTALILITRTGQIKIAGNIFY